MVSPTLFEYVGQRPLWEDRVVEGGERAVVAAPEREGTGAEMERVGCAVSGGGTYAP